MRRTVAIDAALAAAVLAVGIAVLTARGLTAPEVVVSVVMTVPLALRRVAPAPVLAVVLVATGVSLVVSDRVIAGDPAPLIGLYTLVAYGDARRLAVLGVGVMALGAVPTGTRWAGEGADVWTVAGAIGIALVHVVLAAALGELRRQALARAADRLRDAAAAERTRIARELHDVVAHALAVVVVQADAGRYAAAADPDAAAGVLGTIGDTARAALTDMRAALGALREDAPADTAGDGARAPQPSARDVDALVARLTDAGLRVDYAVDGDPRPLGDAAGLALYRIVQEALTNVVKHAGDGAVATVRVRYAAGDVHVEISDDGASGAAPSTRVSRATASDGRGAGLGGHGAASDGRGAGAGGFGAASDGRGSGLVGMRERVGVVGGEVEAGPDGTGWRVRARIPA